MAVKKSTPTIRLRRLAGQLRRLREANDLRREDVEERTGLNSTTLYRIETARSRPQYRTLDLLLRLYGVGSEEHSRLKALYRQSEGEGWIQPWHEDLRAEYTTYISFEREAQSLRHYSGMFVPGLLQTEDYARALVGGILYAADPARVEDRVRVRMERKANLVREKRLPLWAILDEAALRREVGGAVVMRAQLAHLLDLAREPHVTIQVVPFGSGAHPGMPGEFIVMEFEDPLDHDLVHVDSQAGEIFLEADTDIKRFRADFDHLVAVAKSPDDSVKLISGIANR
ncbi:helix-turn-helix domain-containing protein [Actinosynnema sp. NPDC059335]|uniref:helix-turn-helix domain-containing protein n=1 Tax=Actinosynnema sp. NPDC059335 TaxID=3346804 RepID=UPI00366F7478